MGTAKFTTKSLISYLTLLLIPVAVLFASEPISDIGHWVHLPFHSFVETLGATVALITAIIILFLSHLRSISKIPFAIPLGFIGMGILDGFHASVYVEQGFVWLHTLATFVGGIIFGTTVFTNLQRVPENPKIASMFVALFAFALGVLVVSETQRLPALVVDGEFTSLAYELNLVGGFGFILAGLKLNSLYLQNREFNLRLLAFLSALFGISGVVFQLSVIWDATWWWWHLLRLVAYLIAFFVLFLAVRSAAYELKARKDQLEQSTIKLEHTVDELEERRTHQDKIFAIIGHELRTPSATIDMLIDDEIREDRDSKNLVEMRRQSKHLISILDDMKLSTDRNSIAESVSATVSMNPAATVERSVQALHNLAEVEHFELSFHCDLDSAEPFVGSAKPLQQILQNLVKNAILHSQGDRVDVRLVAEPLSETLTRFTLSVIDNGQGINKADQVLMYEAFERGSTSADGLGLGLHICKELTDTLVEGELSYQGTPGGGATFQLGFTLARESVEDAPREADPAICSIEGARILLVEDTPMLRMLGKKLLEGLGATVLDAEDGVRALEVYEAFDPDLVLTDIMMPNMDGYELTRTLRARGYSKPIIGVTGATVGSEAAQLVECGANRVLAKPLTVEALRMVMGASRSA